MFVRVESVLAFEAMVKEIKTKEKSKRLKLLVYKV